MDKVYRLTRCCVVLVTAGSVLDGLPVKGESLTITDIDALVAATEAHQESILDAVSAYKRRTRSSSLKNPSFPKSPTASDFDLVNNNPIQRALSTANYARRAWTVWLQSDEERRSRTIRPRTGETPWMMPEDLSSPGIASVPATLAPRFHEQSLV